MPPLEQVLDALEDDTRYEAGALFTALAASYFAGTRAGDGPVSTPLSSDRLAPRFDEPMPEHGRPLDSIVDRIARDVVAHANHLFHPMYAGHQVSAPLPAAVWTEQVIAALNNSLAVAEMSPTLTVLETQVVRWMCAAVGWTAGSGGTMTSGGTEATFTALAAARAALLPDAWRDGVGPNPPVVLCGEHAHYAVTRAVGQLGLGTRSALTVPTDARHAMDPEALERMLARLADAGTPVMAVVATAGSTATGTFDDLDAIGRSCERRGIWLHVDGAHGASALLSERHRHRVHGLARARSVAWDPHKMMLLPLQAGVLLVRDEDDIQRAYAQSAPYLFHRPDGASRAWDQGTRSFMCSRRGDVLKLWVVLQRYGCRGIAALHDHLCDLALHFHAEIAKRPDFEALHAPESNILCFRYVGDGAGTEDELDALNGDLRQRFNQSGAGWITATNLDGRRVLRVTMMNPRTTTGHVTRLVEGIGALGESLMSGRMAVAD